MQCLEEVDISEVTTTAEGITMEAAGVITIIIAIIDLTEAALSSLGGGIRDTTAAGGRTSDLALVGSSSSPSSWS